MLITYRPEWGPAMLAFYLCAALHCVDFIIANVLLFVYAMQW